MNRVTGPSALQVMGIMGVYMMLVQIHRSAGGVLAGEFASARGLAPTEIATVIGALYLASAVAQVPTGLLFDRYGARLTLAGSGLVAVAGIVVFALAQSAGTLTAGRFLIGVGHGGVIAGLYLLALTWAPPSRVAQFTATVVGVAGGLGAVLATAPLALALRSVGFEATFFAIAVCSLAVTVAVLVFVRDAPSVPGGKTPHPPETLLESLRGLAEVATDRDLRPLFIMGTCFSAPFMTVGGLWAGPYLRDVYQLSGEETSVALLAMVVAFHAGTFIYGHLDRLLGTRKWVIVGGAVAMVAWLVPLAAWPGLGLPGAVLLLVGFSACAPFYPVLAAQCRGFIPAHRAGRAIACVNLTGLTTVFAFQSLTGWIVESSAEGQGYRWVFAAVAAMLMLALAAYLRAHDVPPESVRSVEQS